MAMSDQDLDSLRHPYESDTEWQLRRRFLEVHSDKFDRRRLLCLASCFINVECYGCEYPAPLMIQLAELIADIKPDVDMFRKKVKESRIKPVCFVKADTDLHTTSPTKDPPKTDNMPNPDIPNNLVLRELEEQDIAGSSPAAEVPLPIVRPVTQEPEKADQNGCSKPTEFTIPPQGPRVAPIQPNVPGTGPPPPMVKNLPVDFVKSDNQYHSIDLAENDPELTKYGNRFVKATDEETQARLEREYQMKVDAKMELVKKVAAALKVAMAKGNQTSSTCHFYSAVQKLGVTPDVVFGAIEKGGRFSCKVILDGIQMAFVPGLNKKGAKQAAFEVAVKALCQPELKLFDIGNGVMALEMPDLEETLPEPEDVKPIPKLGSKKQLAAPQEPAAAQPNNKGPGSQPAKKAQPNRKGRMLPPPNKPWPPSGPRLNAAALEMLEGCPQPMETAFSGLSNTNWDPGLPRIGYKNPTCILPSTRDAYVVDYEARQLHKRPRKPVWQRLGYFNDDDDTRSVTSQSTLWDAMEAEEEEEDQGYPVEPSKHSEGYAQASSKRREKRKRGYKGPVNVSDILLVEHQLQENGNALSILHNTEAFNKQPFDIDFREEELLGERSIRCTVYLGHEMLGSSLALSKASAKAQAAQKALDRLRTCCYTVLVKQSADTAGSEVSRDGLMEEIVSSIPASNIGSQLLKKMGWSGGGVGKEGQGISEPVSVQTVINREGLGLQAEKGVSKNFLPTIQTIIHKYARSDDQKDLAFSPDFSKEERAIIHKEAQRIGLKSHSHGKGEGRHLVLSRKRNASELYRHIVNMGGETDKYKLVAPSPTTSLQF